MAGTATPEVVLDEEPPAIEEKPPVQTQLHDARHEDEDETPLAAWARAAIVLVALVAFFAVSLIATKHV